jgi:hypothetical protein
MRASLSAKRDRKIAATRRRVLVIGISVTCHAALIAGLVFDPQHFSAPPTSAAIEVEFVPPPRNPRPEAVARSVTREHPTSPTSKTAPLDATLPSTARSGPGMGNGAVTKPPTTPEVDAGLAAALRSTVGCDSSVLLHLSPSERRDCERLARLRGAGVGTIEFGVDRDKRLALEAAGKRGWLQTPGQKPKNGCALGSYQDAAAGKSAALGLNCAWQF